MTNEQKYSEVLKELGALLADKNATISCQRWQITQLQEKLAKAEQELQEAEHQISSLLRPCEYGGDSCSTEGGAA